MSINIDPSRGAESWSNKDEQDDSSTDTQVRSHPEGKPIEPNIREKTVDNGKENEYINLTVTQINYSTEYISGSSNDQRPVIHLFCRVPFSQHDLNQEEFIQIDVRGFEPYFYIPVKQAKRLDKDEYDSITKIEYTDNQGNEFKSIRHDTLAKVVTDTPRAVGEIRDDFDHYEADVLFPDRFLIDKGITSDIKIPVDKVDTSDDVIAVDHTAITAVDGADSPASPRIHTCDIEVEDRNGFPDQDEATEPILCITAHDSYDDEYTVWYYNDTSVSEPVPDTISYSPINELSEDSINIKKFDTELELLEDYIDYLSSTNPDILTGWNFEDFDATYLINRVEKLDNRNNGISNSQFSRIGEVWDGGWGGPNIKGRVIMDLLEAYKRTKFTELESYRLDDVGQRELDIGKEHFDGNVGDLWANNPAQLIKYNLRDVEICVELDNEQSIIPFWNEVRKFVGCRLEDAPTPGNSVDMYVLQKVHGDFILPSKGQVEGGDEYEGGAVFEPITGIEEYVSVLDLKSLYPMCMCTINASPETKVDPNEYNGDTYVAPNDVHYRKDKDGIIRNMVDELLAEREKKKELRDEHDPNSKEYHIYDRQQSAVKVIMNSLYGTLGWERFRLYDKDNAAAVTATGRGVIEFTEQKVEEMGYEVTYGDTDSVMLKLNNIDNANSDPSDEFIEKRPEDDVDEIAKIKAAIDTSFDIENRINKAYDKYAANQLNAESHRFEIEFEKLYKLFLQAGKKKRYAGHMIWKEHKHINSTDITGFEYQRSDTAQITKEVQKRVIEQLVTGKDIDEVQQDLTETIQRVKQGDVSIEKVGIPGGIGKALDEYETPTAQVRGAKYANALLGTNFTKGSKPKRVYLRRVRSSFYSHQQNGLNTGEHNDDAYREFKRNEDVICFTHEDQIPSEFEIDWEKMVDKTLRSPISRLLEAVDLTWDDVKESGTQSGLENFM